jgi:large subunit ribosomal protein L3
MVTGLIGKKVGMTQLFGPDGAVHPATVLKAGPCVVSQVKTVEKDGYEAVQLGLVEARAHKENKPTEGHFKKAGVPPTRVRREVRLKTGGDPLKAGDQVNVSMFTDGERVDVIGTSRGKGFPGRRQAPPLQRGARVARLDVPQGARVDRRVVLSVACRERHAHGRPHGQRRRHHSQLEGAARRR